MVVREVPVNLREVPVIVSVSEGTLRTAMLHSSLTLRMTKGMMR
jgi:hypothetical protein